MWESLIKALKAQVHQGHWHQATITIKTLDHLGNSNSSIAESPFSYSEERRKVLAATAA